MRRAVHSIARDVCSAAGNCNAAPSRFACHARHRRPRAALREHGSTHANSLVARCADGAARLTSSTPGHACRHPSRRPWKGRICAMRAQWRSAKANLPPTTTPCRSRNRSRCNSAAPPLRISSPHVPAAPRAAPQWDISYCAPAST